MKKKILGVSFMLALLGSAPAAAQISLVNPVPQKVEVAAGELLDAPQAWSVKTDAGRAESFAVKALLLSSVKQDAKAPFTLTLGVKGDKSVKKYAKQVPARAEGYFLQITPKGAVIAAADEQGLFYGVQTLLASVSEGKLQPCTLTDWPDVDFRGTVEGFYGTPWSHKARLSQIEFYGRNKMNVYIYGP